MAIKKINYINKVEVQNKDISLSKREYVTAADLNEIKDVVNNNADEGPNLGSYFSKNADAITSNNVTKIEAAYLGHLYKGPFFIGEYANRVIIGNVAKYLGIGNGGSGEANAQIVIENKSASVWEGRLEAEGSSATFQQIISIAVGEFKQQISIIRKTYSSNRWTGSSIQFNIPIKYKYVRYDSNSGTGKKELNAIPVNGDVTLYSFSGGSAQGGFSDTITLKHITGRTYRLDRVNYNSAGVDNSNSISSTIIYSVF